jgi:hypothetical protein
MADHADTVMGVTRDIVVAMIQKENSSIGSGLQDEAIAKVVKAYSAIYDIVEKKYNG